MSYGEMYETPEKRDLRVVTDWGSDSNVAPGSCIRCQSGNRMKHEGSDSTQTTK